IRLGTALKVAVPAGAIAGLALGLFHLALTEPVIERALVIEQGFAAREAEIVSRGLQKLGLVLGSGIFGTALGVLLGLLYPRFTPWLPGRGLPGKGLALVAFGYWSITL